MYTLNAILLASALQQKNKGIEDTDPQIRDAAKYFAEHDGNLKKSSARVLSTVSRGMLCTPPLKDLPILDLATIPEKQIEHLERFLEKYHYTRLRKLRVPLTGLITPRKWQLLTKFKDLRVLHLNVAFPPKDQDKSIENLVSTFPLLEQIKEILLEGLGALAPEKVVTFAAKCKNKIKALDLGGRKDIGSSQIDMIVSSCPYLAHLKMGSKDIKGREEILKSLQAAAK